MKKFLAVVLGIISVLLISNSVMAITVAWTHSDSPPEIVQGYRIYYQLADGTGDVMFIETDYVTEATIEDTNFTQNKAYKVWATAFSPTGEESGPSNEVSFYNDESGTTFTTPLPPGGMGIYDTDPDVPVYIPQLLQ